MAGARCAIVVFAVLCGGARGDAQERGERPFPPSQAEVAEARAALRNLFPADYAAEDADALRALADKLRDRLPLLENDAAGHYTTLCEIRDVSARTADALGAAYKKRHAC